MTMLLCLRQHPRELKKLSPHVLVQRPWLLVEHGHDQADACRSLLAAAGFRGLVSIADLAGIPRVAGGRRE